jgi:hypothetical protein
LAGGLVETDDRSEIVFINELHETTVGEDMPRHRELKGFAYSIAHKFSCSAEHYAWLALHHREPAVTIDLCSLCISPAVFDIERNRTLAGYCRESLLWIAEKIKPVEIRSAVLSAWFDIDNVKPDGRYAWLASARFTVTLTDERERVWVGELTKNRQFVCG